MHLSLCIGATNLPQVSLLVYIAFAVDAPISTGQTSISCNLTFNALRLCEIYSQSPDGLTETGAVITAD